MDKFGLRTISSLILVSAMWVVVFVFPAWMFSFVIMLFVGFGMFEFFKMVQNRGIFVYKYFGTLVGSIIPIVVYLAYSVPGLADLETFLIVIASLFALVLQFLRRDGKQDHLISTAVTLFALFYIGWFFSFFVKLRLMPGGVGLVAFLIVVTKSADIGAYLIGRTFGKTHLFPRISPKKTREGTLGGIVVSTLFAVTLGRILTGFSFPHLVILGISLSILGQLGDLAESLIKRDCNVKDTGTKIAGIGGVMDLIDSMLFTAPIFYFYVNSFVR